MRGGASTRGAAMRGRGAGPGVYGAGPGVYGAGLGVHGAGPIAVEVPEGPVGEGSGHGLLQIVPAGGPPPLVAPYGGGGANPMPMSPQGYAGALPEIPGAGALPEIPGVPAPMSPIGQACGGSPPSSATSSASSDEDECPNRNRQLNAPKPIGDRFKVTLQQSPGMIWIGGRLRDGNSEQFASTQNPRSGGKKKNGRNKKRNGNRGRGGQGSSGHQDPPRDPEEDAILDYVPILGPKPQ